jgi:hypothetical protein
MVDEPDLQKMFEKMSLTIVQANTAWARVENAMAGLLEKLLGDYSKENIALHIYFAPNNTETRFKIVDTVARVKWQNHKTHDLLGEWNLIHASLGRAKDVRNRLAHGEIQTPGRQIDGKLKFQSRLTASSWDVGRRAKEDNPRQWPGMSVRDVKATADRCDLGPLPIGGSLPGGGPFGAQALGLALAAGGELRIDLRRRRASCSAPGLAAAVFRGFGGEAGSGAHDGLSRDANFGGDGAVGFLRMGGNCRGGAHPGRLAPPARRLALRPASAALGGRMVMVVPFLGRCGRLRRPVL